MEGAFRGQPAPALLQTHLVNDPAHVTNIDDRDNSRACACQLNFTTLPDLAYPKLRRGASRRAPTARANWITIANWIVPCKVMKCIYWILLYNLYLFLGPFLPIRFDYTPLPWRYELHARALRVQYTPGHSLALRRGFMVTSGARSVERSSFLNN